MSRVVITPACLRDATFVVANLRPRDREEIWCQLPEDTHELDVAYFLLMGGDCWIASIDGRPIMFFGVTSMNIACMSVWAVGTRRTSRVVRDVTRFLIGEAVPAKIAAGFHTMEARSHVDHAQAHRWMQSTGAVVVGEPFVYGRQREKFLLFRWTADAIGEAAKRYKVT